MLVSLGFYKRKPGLSWEQFSHHWPRTRMRDVPEYQALILPDEALFLDLSATRVAAIDHPFVQVPGDAALMGLLGAMGSAAGPIPGVP